MKQYLHVFDYAVWITIAILQWILAVIAFRKGLARIAPRYVAFISFATLQTMALLAISQFMPYAVYFWAFYIGDAIEAALLFFVVYDVYRNVFDPLSSLPPRTVAKSVAAVAVIVTLSITLWLWKPAVQPSALSALALGRTFERTTNLVVSLSFWGLVFYARKMGIPWQSRMAGIAKGFLLFLTIQSITTAALGFAPNTWVGTLSRIGVISYLASLIVWLRAVQLQEPEGVLPTPEELVHVAAAVQQMGAAAGKLGAVERKSRWQAE